ncbi:MAG: oligosaccharide flippase family protein [Nitrospirae bacterium]|nr:oligosaccharide flippase family protein [Nitrospirota bacterium]
MFKFQFSQKFIAESFWSLFGNIVSVFAGLAAVKIITKLVVSDDYGRASLVLGVIALLNSLLVGPLMAAHMRVYFDYIEREMALWYSRVFNKVLIVAGLTALLIYAMIGYVYNFIGNHIFLTLIIPAALMILAQPYMTAITSYLEAHRRQKQLATVNILQKALHPIFLFLLLMTVISPVKAIVISQGAVILILLLFFNAHDAQRKSDKLPEDANKELAALRKSMMEFGWALPLSYTIMWFLTTSDRYLIDHFMNPREVGIYSMNYGFWSMPFLMLNGWLEILTRPYLYDKAAKNDWKGVKQILLRRTFFAVTISLLGAALLYILAERIASVMLGNSYWFGWQLMIAITVAHCFMVIGYSVMPAFLAGKKPMMILAATLIAALSNIIINLFVIPAYGLIGAAMSTLISYIIWAFVLVTGAYLLMRRLIYQYNDEENKNRNMKK